MTGYRLHLLVILVAFCSPLLIALSLAVSAALCPVLGAWFITRALDDRLELGGAVIDMGVTS